MDGTIDVNKSQNQSKPIIWSHTEKHAQTTVSCTRSVFKGKGRVLISKITPELRQCAMLHLFIRTQNTTHQNRWVLKVTHPVLTMCIYF